MIYFLFLLLIPALVLVVRPITTLVHELGHAIPAILFTGQKTAIFLGSYGDRENSLHIHIGKLDLYFRFNPLQWQSGLCVPSVYEMSFAKQFFHIIGGAVFSFLLGLVTVYTSFAYDLHGFLKLFCIILFASSLLDLFINLVPSTTPVLLHDGRHTFNDGYLLKMIIHHRKISEHYGEAAALYHSDQFAEAAAVTDKMLRSGSASEEVFRLCIFANMHNQYFEKVIETGFDFEKTGRMNSDDYGIQGYAFAQLAKYEQSIAFYDRSLSINPDNPYSLNNKGYTLNLMEQYELAIACFDKAIGSNAYAAYAYNNRGLSKIKLNQPKEGLKDIEYSLSLDAGNSYAHRNLGIYHAYIDQPEQALQLFEKAKKLDSNTHMIDELIAETRSKLSSASSAMPGLVLIKYLISVLLFTVIAGNATAQTSSGYGKIISKFEEWKSIQYKNRVYEAPRRCRMDSALKESYDGPGIGIPNEIDVFFGDINGDSKSDALITFRPVQCDGGNALMNAQKRVLILSDRDFYSVDENYFDSIEDSLKKGWLYIERVADGIFYGKYFEYKDDDGRCCPGIRRPIEISFQTKKLSYTENGF